MRPAPEAAVSLLEKALAVKPVRKPRAAEADMLELAVAFFRGEVNYHQAAAALGKSHRNVCSILGATLRNGAVAGRVNLERVTP
jgi:hypothetical protein